MSNLSPKLITDKNGKNTTVHVNPDKGVSAGTAERVAGAAPKPVATAPVNASYGFASTLDDFKEKEHFDVRDIKDAFDSYAVYLDEYLEEFDVEDTSTITFDPEDKASFEALKVEAAKWNEALNALAENVSNIDVPEEPTSESVKDWSEYVFAISKGWDDVGDNHAVTLTSDDHLESWVKERAEEVGDLNGVPDYIKKAIDWERVADKTRAESPEMSIDGTTFYLD